MRESADNKMLDDLARAVAEVIKPAVDASACDQPAGTSASPRLTEETGPFSKAPAARCGPRSLYFRTSPSHNPPSRNGGGVWHERPPTQHAYLLLMEHNPMAGHSQSGEYHATDGAAGCHQVEGCSVSLPVKSPSRPKWGRRIRDEPALACCHHRGASRKHDEGFHRARHPQRRRVVTAQTTTKSVTRVTVPRRRRHSGTLTDNTVIAPPPMCARISRMAGGTLAETGAVSFMFDRVGVIEYAPASLPRTRCWMPPSKLAPMTLFQTWTATRYSVAQNTFRDVAKALESKTGEPRKAALT